MRAMAETTLGSQSHRLILGFVPLSPLVFACFITHLPNEQEESHPKMEVGQWFTDRNRESQREVSLSQTKGSDNETRRKNTEDRHMGGVG